MAYQASRTRDIKGKRGGFRANYPGDHEAIERVIKAAFVTGLSCLILGVILGAKVFPREVTRWRVKEVRVEVPPPTPAEPAPEASPAPKTHRGPHGLISTSERAWIDAGPDLEEITVWWRANRKGRVYPAMNLIRGSLPHGAQVEVLEIRADFEPAMIRVRSRRYSVDGWVSDLFLTP